MTWNDQIAEAIQTARLMRMSPDGVLRELEEYGSYQLENSYSFRYQELEPALLTRPEPLVHLGLAQFGMSKEVGQALYKDASSLGGDNQYKKALRIAILGNPRFPIRDYTSNGGFGPLDAAQLSNLVRDGDHEEVKAMLCNPGGKALLCRMFAQQKPFDSVPPERFVEFLRICRTNPALTLEEDTEDAPDLVSWNLQKGLLHLVNTLPVNEQSLEALYALLLNINPNHASNPGEDPQPILDRWRKMEISERLTKYAAYITHTSLNLRDEFLCLAASLYGQVYRDGKFTLVGSLNHPDQVMRCCYYGHMSPKDDKGKSKSKELEDGFARDKDVFIFAMMQNISMPTAPVLRALIERHMAGNQIDLYYKRLKQSNERWGRPEIKAATEWGADLMEDVLPKASPEIQRIEKLETHIAALTQQLRRTWSLVQWVLLGVVVLLVLRLLHK